MMRQLCFFVGSTWMVVSQFALMYGSFPQLDRSTKSDAEFEKNLVMLAVNGEDSASAAKLAPWLTPPRPEAAEATQNSPRAFILESITDVAKAKYGLDLDLDGAGASNFEQNRVASLLSTEICARELHLASTASACENQLEMTKCTTCSSTDGIWYSSVSQAGSAFAHTLPDSTVLVSSPATTYKQLDIVVSSAPNEAFVTRLSKTLAQFRSQTFNGQTNADLILRLIILFDGKRSPSDLQKDLAQRIGLADQNNIVLVSSRGASEKLIVSSLYEKVCSEEDCLVISFQDTTTISSSFLRNCMAFVQPFASLYFPVSHTKEGLWQSNDYGSFALSGSDAKLLGGAGQDAFFQRVQQHRNIVRMQENGLTYEAPPPVKRGASIPDTTEGNLRGESPTEDSPGSGDFAPATRVRRRRRNKKAAAVVESVPPEDDEATAPIFIAVTTSRPNFVKRVSTIMNTWGADLPAHVVIGFFIGHAPRGEVVATSENLAKLAGLEDAFSIIEVDVPDEEEVKKNAAVLKHSQKLVRASQAIGETTSIGWVYHVEDDAYINVPKLTELTKDRSPKDQHFVGLPGNRTGVTQPFCMGGPGYLLSQATLATTAPHLDTCVADIDMNSEPSFRKSVWHSDVLVGLCVFLQAGIGCSGDVDESNQFVHLSKTNPWTVLREKTEKNGPQFVSVHPLWAEGHMQNVYKSVQIGVNNKANGLAALERQQALSPATSLPTLPIAERQRKLPRRFQKQLESMTTPDGAMEIPKSLILAAEVYPEFQDRLFKIRRWRILGQEKVVERLIRKSLQRLKERGDV